MSITKDQVANWLAHQIANAGWNRSQTIAGNPCVEGAQFVLDYLNKSEPEAKTIERPTISKPEIDETVKNWEQWLEGSNHFRFDKGSFMEEELVKLINYIKTAPLLPAEPTDEMKCKLYGQGTSSSDTAIRVGGERYKQLYEYLTTPPKPKTRMVWFFAYVREEDGRRTNEIYKTYDEKDANRDRNYVLGKGIPISLGIKYSNVSPIWTEEEIIND